MADVLAKSSNIGAIQIALKIGERPLYEYQSCSASGRKPESNCPENRPVSCAT